MPRSEYVTLDGYTVHRTTERAIGIAKGDEDDLIWLPRSLVEDGDEVTVGETDVSVAQWKADQEFLDY